MDPTRLAKALPADVISLCRRLAGAGFRAWVVGGCVRDLLLASSADLGVRNDWDLATDARPEQVQALFKKVIPTGIKHGTVTVMLGRQGYEVTTLRGETTYSDGRRPDQVYFVDDIRADLERRDFTVNAIAYDPLEGVLIDPFAGAEDLARRLLRAVGDPAARFGEDGLRVLRAARFVATLEMELEPGTAAAIRPSLETYRRVSPERIRDEWLKALKAKQPSRAFQVMLDHGMLEISVPELFACNSFPSGHPGIDSQVWSHLMLVVDHCPADPVLRTAALLHDVGEPALSTGSSAGAERQAPTPLPSVMLHAARGAELAAAVCQRLRFSNAERELVAGLVRYHAIPYAELESPPALRRWLRDVGIELLPQLWQLAEADLAAVGGDRSALSALQRRVEGEVNGGVVLSTKQLVIGGSDLMQQLALPPGKQLGVLLNQLLERVIEQPELNQREALLELARQLVADQR